MSAGCKLLSAMFNYISTKSLKMPPLLCMSRKTNMKLISILSLLCLLTLGAHSSSQKMHTFRLKKKLTKMTTPVFFLEMHKEKSGSMWYKEKAYLYSEFNITISNTENTDKQFPAGTCIMLFDKDSDNQILASGIDLNLLDSYKPYESKSGRVIFRSESPEIQSLRFIKLSKKECHSSENGFIAKP